MTCEFCVNLLQTIVQETVLLSRFNYDRINNAENIAACHPLLHTHCSL